MKRLGPELKMPKFKSGETRVPPFLADLYYDVRDRRLLPVILLILVAIVAAPVLLKDEPEEVSPPEPPAAVNPGAAQASAKTLTVVKSSPGLRDYKERLKHQAPSNPFKQQYTGAKSGGGELNEPSTTTTEESTGGSETPSGTPTGGETIIRRTHHVTFFTFAVRVRISKATTKPDGTVEQSEPEDREKVMAPTPLPGEKVPVVTYIGLSDKNHLPLFMVSEDVTAVFGEGDCVAGTAKCQLIELEPGMPEIFEYGDNHVRYKINVLEIVRVVTGKS